MANDSGPLISIGMPVRNSTATVQIAICSILSQTFKNWELIIIDDGSTDDTFSAASRIRDSRIKLIHSEKSLGLPAQLNETIALSQGDYFARMDGDDVSYPYRLQHQLEYMEAHPEIDLIGAGVVVFNSTGEAIGKRLGPITHEEICSRPWARLPLTHPTYMGRMSWFRNYGYRDEFLKAQDQDLLLRSYPESRFTNLPDILLGYREEQIDLKKILISRRYFGKAAFQAFQNEGEIPLAFRAVIEQILKGLVDIFATITGLRYRILSHRASPIEQNESREWDEIWALLTQQLKQYE